MNKKSLAGSRRFLPPAVAAALLLSGCGTAPSRFYQLTAEPPAGPAPVVTAAPTVQPRVIGVDSVRVPGYLDRPEIVMRGAGSRLTVLEYDRWGGSLEGMVTHALAQDLGRLLGGAEVVELPLTRDVPLNRTVEVTLDRFDAAENGPAVLEARWRVFGATVDRSGDRTANPTVRFGRTAVQEPVATPADAGAVADALSRLLARLAADIAGALPPGS